MKNLRWCLSALTALIGLTVSSGIGAAFAAEEVDRRTERVEPRLNQMVQHQEQLMRQVGGQMERLEQRLNQMAERQEQFMRQVGGQMERIGASGQAGRENMRPPVPAPQGNRRPILPEVAAPAVRQVKALSDLLGLFFLVWIICNVLMAVWIFTDIRKRGEGPAIFVAMALLAGIPAAAIYSLIRIGDRKAAAPRPEGSIAPAG